MGYFGLMILITLMGLAAQLWIKSSFNKWSKVPMSSGITGAQAARQWLDQEGLHSVRIICSGAGNMEDYYDPKKDCLVLSDDSYYGSSVASVAIACHEAGHAVQHARRYAFASLRQLMFPVVSIASNLWIYLLMAGIFLHLVGLVQVAIVLFACTFAYQLVTLPVEIDASRRAIQAINSRFAVIGQEQEGVKGVLVPAAFTYVAAALASGLQLLYLIASSRR